jgi:muramoyltetrapeptide carboxypeptidase
MAKTKPIQPAFLKPGDTVGIVAPARKISEEELLPSIKILQSWGLNVKLGKHIYSSDHQYAGTDTVRGMDLQTMMNDADARAIFSARGGYGSVRIIDKIDLSLFKKHPKWIVGYSDVTVLHSHIHAHTSIETMHGTMPINFEKDAESLELLKKALFGEQLHYNYSAHSLNRQGEAEGLLIGGNLSLLYALASTPSDIDTTGKILFLEDLDEYLYHIDRMMMQLKRSGKLARLSGLLVGSFSEMKDNTIPFGKTAEEIISDAVKEYAYPVAFGFPAGHGIKNYPLSFGRTAKLSVANNCALSFR